MASPSNTHAGVASIATNLASVRAQIARAAALSGRPAEAVRLLLATKTQSPERILEALAAGQRDLGENRVQEGQAKAEALAGRDIRWSMIGHLQTNKVKDVLRFADEVQSLDRLPLAVALDRRLQRLGRGIDVLVQVNTSGEATKYGLPPDGVPAFLHELAAFPSLRVRGFMTLARFTSDTEEVRRCFRALREIRDSSPNAADLPELSMGMSSDFEIAIAEGATIVRVGQAVFGRRALPDAFFWPGDGKSAP
ncbi:MAG TPA: YggS family pyridoxal phosphate-dependent enzyme [Hyphomicrobium sp.]|nr:YggS family pyridoxal phosphate-dependent enzyme [Hyphomicrobium sp.]